MHFRYYGSNIGRFMKPDNVTGSPLNPQNWNLYSYVRGNPVIMNDPTGHEGEEDERVYGGPEVPNGEGENTPEGDVPKEEESNWWEDLWAGVKEMFVAGWEALYPGNDGTSSDQSSQKKALIDQGVLNEDTTEAADLGKKADTVLKDAAATGATIVTKETVTTLALAGAGKLAGKTVGEMLVLKKGSIKNAPLPKGAPGWDQISKMTMKEVEARARANEPGFKEVYKLLTQKRFDK
jgi:hypothetical protein